MVFNSIDFALFLPIVFLLYWFVTNSYLKLQNLLLLSSSYLFYGWWDWRFLFLIIASGLIDYFSGLAIAKYQSKKNWFLWLSLLGNIGSLAIFKYLDFFIDNINYAGSFFGSSLNLSPLELILPVGISFYTFQSMSYTIDVYRGEMKPTKNIAHFFAYLSMFPQLVAGPIVRAKDLIPALETEQPISSQQLWTGLRWIVHGFFKKMVIADSFAPAVATAFESEVAVASAAYWWLIVIMFAFQIYCDFSGYSDIARGLGKWMGFEFPENFNHPYVAVGFRDFWSRWHISLSTWFRDYVYVPLGGSRVNASRAHWNMWVTMLVSGLWHGAAWTFVIWGALHAFYLSVERLTNWPKKIAAVPVIGRATAIAITFGLACIAWCFFRATSATQAFEIISCMGNVGSINVDLALQRIGTFQLLLIGLVFLREGFFAFRFNESAVFKSEWFENIRVVWLAIVIVATVLFRGPGATFIYFQF